MKKDKEWQLQEAKNKFSQVFNEALKHGAQIITRNGKEKVLLIALQDYKKIINQKNNKLSSFFRGSPLVNAKLDLSRSKDSTREISL